MMLTWKNFHPVHWLIFTHSTQWEVLWLLLFPVIRIFHRDLTVPMQSTEQAELWQMLTLQQQHLKIKIVKNYLCNCNFIWCTKTRPHWEKKKTGERHSQQTRFWCVLSSDDCTGSANTMSSTACRQKPWQALIPSATSPAYLRLCKISVFYFHAKEILVTAFFLCGEMCITCAGYLWWYKMLDLAEHPSPRGWQAAGHWGGLVVPLSALPGLPPTEGPGKGRNIPVGITIHSVTCSPSITGRSWCISNPFPQRILFSTSSSSPLFYGF